MQPRWRRGTGSLPELQFILQTLMARATYSFREFWCSEPRTLVKPLTCLLDRVSGLLGFAPTQHQVERNDLVQESFSNLLANPNHQQLQFASHQFTGNPSHRVSFQDFQRLLVLGPWRCQRGTCGGSRTYRCISDHIVVLTFATFLRAFLKGNGFGLDASPSLDPSP